MSKQQPEGGGVTRLSFIKAGATVAAGAAAVAIPAVAQAHEEGVITAPSSENPAEPVMAYVRDAKRGEVTVMHGTRETTYRDPALAKRLIKAAPKEGVN